MRTLQLLPVYVWRELLQALAWRGFLFTLVVNQAIAPLLGLAVWSAALPGRAGFSTYYVALLAVQLMTVSYEAHTFANGIYNGSLSGDLLRPRPVVFGVLAANLALRLWHLLFGLPIVAVAATVAGVAFTPAAVLLAIPAMLLAAALRFLFIYLLALSAFWTQQAQGVVGLGETLIFLLGGAAAPLALFPAPFRALGEALPFGAMLGFPAQFAAGTLRGDQARAGYGWQVLWIAVFLALAVWAWQAGVRRYTAIGG